MPSNWSKLRDEWLDRTAIAKDDAKWALEALINSEDELFEIEQKINNKEDVILAGTKLIDLGAKNVLIKGGHLKSKNVQDVFMNKSDLKVFISSRHRTGNTHGTGCTLSSAITTFFSCGKSIKKACELGIKYVNSAILTNPRYGKGHGPINHLNSILINKNFK